MRPARSRGERAYTDLFDPQSEFDVGHIRLARDTDLIVVAPATADLIAKMAGGHADDLATAVLLATDKPILIAPAMNPQMWAAKATQRNLAQLRATASHSSGRMPARWPSAAKPASAAWPSRWKSPRPPRRCCAAAGSLAGKRVLVTSGPTSEPIDPVRVLANRSSGKQGHAIAAAAAAAGADVVLVSGPVNLPDPPGVPVVHVETARQMLAAVEKALPADIAVFAAAVADWRPQQASQSKIKKHGRAADPRARGKSRHPLDHRASQVRPAAAGHRLCRRDRQCHRQRQGEAREERLRLDPRQRRLAGRPASWAATATRFIWSPRTASKSWPPQSKEDVARALIARIADALQGGETVSGGEQRRGSHHAAAARRRSAAAAIPKRARRRPRSPRRGAGRRAGRACARRARARSRPASRSRCRPATKARSGRARVWRPRHGVTVLNAPGTVDADYRGELQVILVNLGAEPFVVQRGMRIAQIVIAPVQHATLVETNELEATERAAGGFGSTGTRLKPSGAFVTDAAALYRANHSLISTFSVCCMSLLPRKGLLAIAAVVDVALQTDGRPISAKTLAARHGLPPRHLESVLQSLVRDGILKGIRGPRGGYELARERQRRDRQRHFARRRNGRRSRRGAELGADRSKSCCRFCRPPSRNSARR